MYEAGELRNGHFIEDQNKLLRVLNYHHNKTGRGGAVIKVKVKDVISGAITEMSCRPGDKFKPADISRQKFQFLYHEGDEYHFMNMNDFNQIILNKSVLDESINFLIENLELYIIFWGEKAIGIDLPSSLNLKIDYTEPGLKGDTVSGATKIAKLETGYELKVPLFVNTGDVVKVDTREGKYLERA
ncbi:MAG: elongation factor P [Candidatus Margulisbacteria bacterium]|nr:elongation factor P [Candidatus Margulisiibacteriota bacterium]